MNDNYANRKIEITLSNNRQWSPIESKMCRIIEFTSIASVKNGKIITIDKYTPYASIVFECSNQPNIFKGLITHREDYKVLWAIFNERKLGKDEEVLFFWSKKHYKNIFYSLLSALMPKFWIMICKKSSFELHTNPNFKPELTGEARWIASQPIEDFKPDVME